MRTLSLVGDAMAQQPGASSGDLERFREYLSLVVRLQLNPRLQGKVDLSGVVQQTLLEAHLALERLRSHSVGERIAWLRQILANNLRDEVRKLGTAARDVTRELSLDAALDTSSSRLEAWLAANESSPSHQAIREEQLLALAHALARLPVEQRQAIELHHLQNWPLADVARHLDRSKGAAAALLFRGLKKLRELMTDADGSHS
jgi:RNA polymerase sigma-70 factor (ECF subfamily)